jgi:NAD dependent epimerase/dehydratase family enzyme
VPSLLLAAKKSTKKDKNPLISSRPNVTRGIMRMFRNPETPAASMLKGKEKNRNAHQI